MNYSPCCPQIWLVQNSASVLWKGDGNVAAIRGVFRTQPNIEDGPCAAMVNGF